VSVRSSELVEVDQPEVPEGSTTTMITPPPTAEKEPVLPTTMPENWMFTGFLVFALFGPIVRPEMRYYQSHLLLVRPKDGGDKKVEIEAGAKTKRKHQKVEVKMEPGDYNRPLPTKNSMFTVSQELQMVAIKQSKVLMESRAKNELNDRIVAMHTKKVAGKKALIEEA
jgi:hypothetical protein